MAVALSVVIPTYLGTTANWEFLIDLSDKLKNLSLVSEIIIVDDASPSAPLESDIPKIDGIEVKLLRNVSRKGPNRARNKGIEEAKSANILLLDFGDFISEELIKLSYENLLQNGSIKLTGGNYTERRKVLFSDREVILEIKKAKFLGEVCPNGSGMAFRKETWIEVGKFDEEIFYGATDRDFGLRVIDRYGRDAIQIYPEPIYHFVKTVPAAAFVRAFRMSRGYVFVLNKRKVIGRATHKKKNLKLMHFNKRHLLKLVRKEGIAYTLSSLFGKVIGRLFWKLAYSIEKLVSRNR